MQNQSVKVDRKRILPRYIYEFIEMESSSGLVMVGFALLAILAANSPWSSFYVNLVDAPVSLGFKDAIATASLKDWVKDVLMVFFFLVIGLELKHEICHGFLSKRDQVILPLFAAVGGMAVPALIFLGLNYNNPETIHGWAIPSATDIAFAVAILTLLGKHIPPAIKIFLLAVAIFDDLGAIIIIATFYSSGFTMMPLLAAAVGIVTLVLLNRLHISGVMPYILVGIFLWFCLHYSGIHTTLAGVIIGLAIPMRHSQKNDYSPVKYLIDRLHIWVNFLILPMFAFTSAGVDLGGMSISHFMEPLPLGIAFGLFLGKQIGIFSTSWLLIKTKLVTMPYNTTWRDLYAVSIIAGIGFTMSLFIGMLAFSEPYFQNMVKVGVMGGSLLCIVYGGMVLRWMGSSTQRQD